MVGAVLRVELLECGLRSCYKDELVVLLEKVVGDC